MSKEPDPESGELSVRRPTSAGPGTDVLIMRSAQEVQAMVAVAQRFPRDEQRATERILKACERFRVADDAEYEYTRGGETVTGPSIRLAEVMARNWGNMDFGFVEVDQAGNESHILAYAWDLETNTRASRQFKQPHIRSRSEKKGGNVLLTDPRDIYELVANFAQRRVRASVLALIPGEIQELAIDRCHKTIKENDKRPMVEKIQSVIDSFGPFGVTINVLEVFLRHSIGQTTERELLRLRRIFNSLKDGIAKPEEIFVIENDLRPTAAVGSGKSQSKAQKMAQTNKGEGKTTELEDDRRKTKRKPQGLKERIASATAEELKGIEAEISEAPDGEQKDEWRQLIAERANALDAEGRLGAKAAADA
jgi:hypothetical protein